uniref:ARAD1A01738p n=1 Tax=Blastobotrys adeninivorans TaxID=409370 RepID=A0A060SW23_BLAAD
MKLGSIVLFAFGAVAVASSNPKLDAARHKLFEQVNLAQAQVYDSAGKLRDDAVDTWTSSQLKEWADIHGIPVPQGSKKAELQAIVRKNKAVFEEDVKSYLDEAAKTADSYLSKATEAVADAGNAFFDQSLNLWSDSRLRAFLAARGVQTPGKTSHKHLVQLAKENANKKIKQAKGEWTFDTWSSDEIKDWLEKQGKKAQGTRDELVASAQNVYSSAAQAGGETYDNIVKSLSDQWDSTKKVSFEKWSDSDLKAYLDTYGIKTYQGSTRNELIAKARAQYGLFTHGADPGYWNRLWDTFHAGVCQSLGHAHRYGNIALSHAQEHGTWAYNYLRQQVLGR